MSTVPPNEIVGVSASTRLLRGYMYVCSHIRSHGTQKAIRRTGLALGVSLNATYLRRRNALHA